MGRELEIHSSPDDPPGDWPKTVMPRLEHKQAGASQGRKVSGSWPMTLLSKSARKELCCVPYQKSTWSHCVISPGRARSPTYFPVNHILFACIDDGLLNIELLTSNSSVLPAWAELTVLLGLLLFLFLLLPVICLWWDPHSRGWGFWGRRVYWTGYPSVWDI